MSHRRPDIPKLLSPAFNDLYKLLILPQLTFHLPALHVICFTTDLINMIVARKAKLVLATGAG